MKKHFRTLAIAIAAILFATSLFAGDKANTAPKMDLKDLTFKSVKIEVQGGAPNGISLDNAFTQEFISRGATQADNGLEITGNAMFMKIWAGNETVRISTDFSAKGISFAGSADYTQNEITSRLLGYRPMKTDELVDKLKKKAGDAIAAQLLAQRVANESKSAKPANNGTSGARRSDGSPKQ